MISLPDYLLVPYSPSCVLFIAELQDCIFDMIPSLTRTAAGFLQQYDSQRENEGGRKSDMTRWPGDVGASRGPDSDIERRGGASRLNYGPRALKLPYVLSNHAAKFIRYHFCDGFLKPLKL
jgi:hypothetical protein